MSTLRVFLPSMCAVLVLATGCLQGEWDDEFGGVIQAGVKGNGGMNGDSHYCIDPAFPCASGEGDCDRDDQCEVGLVCARDNGAQFGFAAQTDVCVPPHCANGTQDMDETAIDCGGADCGPSCGGLCDDLPAAPSRNHCTPTCPCSAGDADCDGDNECVAGLECGADLGDQFGFGTTDDVCVAPHCNNGTLDADETSVDCGGADCGTNCGMDCAGVPANGQPGHCTTTCLCMQGHGDCDGDDFRCVSGQVCIEDSGDSFGFGAGIDMCLPAHCESGTLDGDELGVDCGGSCADCPAAANVFGGASSDRAYGVARDAAGNVVLVGRFNADLDFGGGALNADAADIFIAKFDAAGAHLWSQNFGGPNNDGDNDVQVAIGPSGEIAVTGNINSAVDFGAGPIGGAGGPDMFVMVLEANGNLRWARAFGGTGIDSGRGIAVRPNGNVVVTGTFENSVSFGGSSFTSAGNRDIFVARYSGTTGAHLASRSFGGTGKDSGYGIVANSSNLYITGAFVDTMSVGSTMLTSAGQEDIFVARLSGTTLAPAWAFRFGGTNGDTGNGIGLDSSNRVYVAGSFKVSVDFGSGPIASAGATDGFVLALSSGGAFRWVRTFGGTGNDIPRGLSANPAAGGSIIVCGSLTGAVTGFPPAFGGRDAFSVRYSTSGVMSAATRDGGTGTDDATACAINSGGAVYTGYYEGMATIDGASATAVDGPDIFYVKP